MSYKTCLQNEICFTSGKFGFGWGLLVYPILLFCIAPSGRTEMFMTGVLNINLINQSISQSIQINIPTI